MSHSGDHDQRDSRPGFQSDMTGRSDLPVEEMDGMLAASSEENLETVGDTHFRPIGHSMRYGPSGCPASAEALAVAGIWTYPATPADIASATGLNTGDIEAISLGLMDTGLLDDLGDGRLVGNHEALVHSRMDPVERSALEALLTSSTGRLYYDEIQLRTQVKDHLAMSMALSALARDGLVLSRGILYEVVRVPFPSK